MAIEEEIIPIAQVKPRRVCPKCKLPFIKRGSRAISGTTLYSLTERCIMCGWKKTIENVRIGV